MNKLRSQLGAPLSRQQMKNVTGGDGPVLPGTRCDLYCCQNDLPSNCTKYPTSLPGTLYCSSNEACQEVALDTNWKCDSGFFLAALCRG